MDKRDEWLGPVGSGDLNLLLCRTALVFYQDKNLLEEEKRRRRNRGSENTGGFSYIWVFEQINHFVLILYF